LVLLQRFRFFSEAFFVVGSANIHPSFIFPKVFQLFSSQIHHDLRLKLATRKIEDRNKKKINILKISTAFKPALKIF
jgi:hypothetical protein